MALHQQIAYYRQKKGLSQRELAARVGVTAGAIGLYETAKCNPSLEVLFRLATALDVTVSELTRDITKGVSP